MDVDKRKKKDDEQKWCPLEYEYLPDFCYTCGLIGHVDKACSIGLGRGEVQQYGRWMKADMRKGREDEKGGWSFHR